MLKSERERGDLNLATLLIYRPSDIKAKQADPEKEDIVGGCKEIRVMVSWISSTQWCWVGIITRKKPVVGGLVCMCVEGRAMSLDLDNLQIESDRSRK